MKKFFLLLAEWWDEQRRADYRAYMFVTTQCSSEYPPPPIGELFDSFKTKATAAEKDVDEFENFKLVSAQLGVLS